MYLKHEIKEVGVRCWALRTPMADSGLIQVLRRVAANVCRRSVKSWVESLITIFYYNKCVYVTIFEKTCISLAYNRIESCPFDIKFIT
jgi:hypothetical protein